MKLQEAEARRMAEGMADICKEINIYYQEVECRGYTSDEQGMKRQMAMLEGYEKALTTLGVSYMETMDGNSDYYWSVEVGGIRIPVANVPEYAGEGGEHEHTVGRPVS